MKTHMLLLLLLITTASNAQLVLPSLSPETVLKLQAGYTTITIKYGRPAARGRTIMGDLVKYGRLWRTGAGSCTRISFDKPVLMDNKTVAPGTYALVSIPRENSWTVLLNTDTSLYYGDPGEYDKATEVLRFNVTPEKTSRFYESLTFDVDVVNNDAIVYLLWEQTQIRFPVYTQTDVTAARNIGEALNRDADNHELLSQAADHYLMNNKNLTEALQLIDIALQLNEDRWYYRQKVEIFKRQKNYKAAKITADKAIVFLQRTKPQEWESEIQQYRKEKRLWPN